MKNKKQGIWHELQNYKSSFSVDNFSLDILTEAIRDFENGKRTEYVPEEPKPSKYVQLTREEVLALKEGDVCYINSSYGMQECIYPHLDGDTHRNLFGKGEANKTIEEKRDWGPIYKLRDGE